MKEITLSVPDQMVALIEQLAAYMPEVEIVSEEDLTVETDRDLCMKQAIETLQGNKAFVKRGDYGLIMHAMNQEVIDDFDGEIFSSRMFVEYLKGLGVGNLPCSSTLRNTYNNISGEFPNWTFEDEPNPTEERRRKSVVIQFRSAYLSAKRNI